MELVEEKAMSIIKEVRNLGILLEFKAAYRKLDDLDGFISRNIELLSNDLLADLCFLACDVAIDMMKQLPKDERTEYIDRAEVSLPFS